MTKNEQVNNRNYLEKLPNITLIPNHGKMGSLPSYPLCGKREIFCGPNLQDKDSAERKHIRTSGYFFDIDEVLSQLNEFDKRIDLVFAPLEVRTTCFPKNLSKLHCPKIAFVFDTHHLLYPISTIINYIKHERFTHVFIYAQPAHLHFFYEAGFIHSAFYPRNIQKFETRNNKKPGVTYIGGKWKSSHLRRSRMVQFLEKNLPKNNIPFHHYNQLPRAIWHKVLARSKIIVLSSLNGQFTPQIISCLFAGALCFVDELGSQTLLHQFFEPGTHLVTWRDFEDLLQKLIYYYHHPKEAEAIAKAGKLQAQNNFATARSIALSISEFVFENKIDSRFLAVNDKRCQYKRVEPQEYFDARIRLYENIQDLHRIHEMLTLISLTSNNLKPSADLADLPRLIITHAFGSERLKNDADIFFQSVGVKNQIKTVILNTIEKTSSYDIGILEKQASLKNWEFLVKSMGRLLKSSSLLWVFGKLTSAEHDILKKEGFKAYVFKKSPIILKVKNTSRKLCYQFWKLGKYPFPYLTIKPTMETVPNLNVFIRGWQANFPFLF